MRRILRKWGSFGLISLVLVGSACGGLNISAFPRDDAGEALIGGRYQSDVYPKGLPSGSIQKFGSEKELEDYIVGALAEGQEAQKKASAQTPQASSEGAADGQGPSESKNETITNNQENGVDEGDIVKNIEQYLVVLRKGRLYAIDTTQAAEPRQTDGIDVAEFSIASQSTWYDELLVKGDLIVVVGYRYASLAGQASHSSMGTTELNLFQLKDGKFTRVASRFQESWDYYSGRNYASRLVNGKLYVYAPASAYQFKDGKTVARLPRTYTLNREGRLEDKGLLFAAEDVFSPIRVPYYPVFHGVTACELDAKEGFTCKASALLSCGSREKYVTPTTAFIWSCDHVYGMNLVTGEVLAHRTVGAPIDQFSFSADHGTLSMITRRRTFSFCGVGFENSRPPYSEPDLSLLSLKLADFDARGEQDLSAQRHRVLVAAPREQVNPWWPVANRITGGKALVSMVRWDHNSYQNRFLMSDLALSGAISETDAAGPVVRIEPLGKNRALLVKQVIWSANPERDLLKIQVLRTNQDDDRKFGSSLSLESYGQGEWRSHGFFYKPQKGESGVLGLAIRRDLENPKIPSWNWASGISFVSVDQEGDLSTQGVISPSIKPDSACASGSCVDWYGNTRPIFLKDKVFGLMGAELQSINLNGGAHKQGATHLN